MRLLKWFIVLIAAAVMALPISAQSGASVTVTPQSGPIGTMFTLTITGLNPSATYRVDLILVADGETVYTTEKVASPDGVVELFIGTEAGDALGDYDVRVRDGDQEVARGRFTLTDETLLTDNIRISPPRATLGRQQTIAISGLAPYLTVQVDITHVESGQIAYSKLWTTSGSGRLQITIVSGEDDPAGVYHVTVRDTNCTLLARGELTLEDPLGGNVTFSVVAQEQEDGVSFTVEVNDARPAAVVTLQVSDSRTASIVYTRQLLTDINGRIRHTFSAEDPAAIDHYDFDFEIDGKRPPNGQNLRATRGVAVASAVTLDIAPQAGPAGTQHTLTASGLAPNERVTFAIFFDGANVFSTEKTASADGVATTTIFTEDSDPQGVYTVRLLRAGQTAAEATLTLQGEDGGAVAVTVDPPSGPEGATHVITITGLNPAETVTIDLVLDGRSVFSTERVADQNGVASATIFSEPGDAGQYTVNILRGGAVIASASLTVEAAAAQPTPTPELTPQPTPLPPVAQEVTLSIQPDSGPIGTQHVVTIRGLGAGTAVDIDVLKDGAVVYSTAKVADDEGNITFSLYSEPDDPAGRYDVVVRGGGVEVARGRFDVIIAEAPPVAATPSLLPADVAITVTAEEGLVGSATTIDISGLIPDDEVTVEVVLNGQVVFKSRRTPDADGHITLALVNPSGALPGDYIVRVYKELGEASFSLDDPSAQPTPAPTVEPPSGAVPSVVVSPESAPRGSVHEIIISGLAPDSAATVDVVYGGAVVYSTARVADAAGEIRLPIQTEASDAVGAYVVRVVQGGQIVALGTFIIEAEASPTPAPVILQITPPDGPRGTTHQIEVFGLAPNSSADVDIQFGGVSVLVLQVTADASGYATTAVVSEPSDPLGDYEVIVSVDGAILATATLTITEVEGGGATPTVGVSPASAEVGQTHTIFVNNLAPDEQIEVRVLYAGDTVYRTTRTADSVGVVNFDIFTEADDPIGEYRIEVLRGGVVVAQTSFTVTERVGQNPVVSVSPSAGTAGDAFTIALSELRPGDFYRVNIVFNGEVVATSQRIADASGNVTFVHDAAPSAADGEYRVQVVKDGRVVAETSFTLSGGVPLSAVTITVTPPDGPRGTLHTIAISGLNADETIAITIELGGRVVYSTERTATADGVVSFPVVTEATDAAGRYTVAVRRGALLLATAELVISEDGGLTPPATEVPAPPAGQRIALGDSLSGDISSAEPTDRYRLSGARGQNLVIRATSADFDAYLRLYGPDGALVAEDDDSGGLLNAELRLALPADGDYILEVTSAGYAIGLGPQNAQGVYQVTVEAAP